MRIVFAAVALSTVLFVSGCATEDPAPPAEFPAYDYWWR